MGFCRVVVPKCQGLRTSHHITGVWFPYLQQCQAGSLSEWFRKLSFHHQVFAAANFPLLIKETEREKHSLSFGSRWFLKSLPILWFQDCWSQGRSETGAVWDFSALSAAWQAVDALGSQLKISEEIAGIREPREATKRRRRKERAQNKDTQSPCLETGCCLHPPLQLSAGHRWCLEIIVF